MSVSEEKNFLRKKYKTFRSEMSPDEKSSLDARITGNVISLKEYKDSSLLLIYVSTETEVDTLQLIGQAFQDGKTVAVPKSLDNNGNMAFYEIHSLGDLEKGYFGIYEPDPGKCREISRFDRGICIVPALSYDRKGYRLGYGKGFYDRFLSAHGEILRVGICYSGCMEQFLPHSEYDVPVHIVITEKAVEDHRKENNSDGK